MLERFRGDSNPMIWEFTINSSPIDFTTVSEIKFSYLAENGIVKSLVGALPSTGNEVIFNVTTDFFDIPRTYNYDIQVTFSDGVVRTIKKDTILIKDDVTK